MAYSRTIWVNDSLPAINAENLNKIENGISESNIFRNLFNVGNAKTSADAEININKTNNQISINGSSSIVTNIFLDSPKANKDEEGIILKAGTYTATIKKVSGSLSGGDIEFRLRKSDGGSIYNGTRVWAQKILSGVSDDTVYSNTFTLEEETRLHWIGYFAGELRTFNNLVLQFQIEESTSATEYTPFAGYIVESGSNDKGKWIKYSDGTMFCWMRAEKTVNYQASGALYVGYLTNIVFPQTFTSEYTPMCFAQNNGVNGIITGQIEGVSATGITRVQCWRASEASTYTILNILAIGKWK